MVSNSNNKDIFERLLNGETIHSHDQEAFKMLGASFATKKLLVQMNNASDPVEIRSLLSKIIFSPTSIRALKPLCAMDLFRIY